MSALPMNGYDPNRPYPQGYPQQGPFGSPMTMPTGNPQPNYEAPEADPGVNERNQQPQQQPQFSGTMTPQQPQAVQQALYRGPNQQYGNTIGQMYQQQLGRAASPWEIQNRLNDPNFNITRHMGDIAGSKEAQAYQQRQQQTAAQPQAAAAPPPTAAAPPAAAGGLGQYANKLEGFDQGKLAGGHDSPKYQFARAMSQFDPKGGIQQGLLDQLNKLGLGQVSGSIGGDKISIANADPRFNGVTEFDIIRDLEGGGGWQWGGIGGAGFRPEGGGGGGGDPIAAALGGGGGIGTGGHPAYAPTHAGGAPYAASNWLKQLLGGLGVPL